MSTPDKKEKIPASWLALSEKLGIPQPTLSQVARSLLASKSGGAPLPSKIPSPMILGAGFVAELTEIVVSKTVTRRITIGEKNSARHVEVDLDKAIREALDEHGKLLGDNLIEFVADELNVSIERVQKCLVARHKALCIEREIKRKEDEHRRAEIQRERARTESRIETTLALREDRPKPIKQKPAPEPVPEAPTRPAAMPEEHVDVELDGFLQACWIAEKAGIPNAHRDAVAALLLRFPNITEHDADKAIETAYNARSIAGKRRMERRAYRLQMEKSLPNR